MDDRIDPRETRQRLGRQKIHGHCCTLVSSQGRQCRVASAPSGMVRNSLHDGASSACNRTKGNASRPPRPKKGTLNTRPTFYNASGLDVDHGELYVRWLRPGGTNKRVAVFDASGHILRQGGTTIWRACTACDLANDGTSSGQTARAIGARHGTKMGNSEATPSRCHDA